MSNKMITDPTTVDTERIDMRSRYRGLFPKTFVWRDGEGQPKEFQVKVRESWTVGEKSKGRRKEDKMRYHFFKCFCEEGEFIVYQDLAKNSWHIVV
jgi:hypothetical protein